MGGEGELGRDSIPVIVMFERTMEVLFAHRADAKGADPTVIKQLCADLDSLGIKRAVYKSDQ